MRQLRDDSKQDEREGSKGPQVGLEPLGCCSEDKASAHGTPQRYQLS